MSQTELENARIDVAGTTGTVREVFDDAVTVEVTVGGVEGNMVTVTKEFALENVAGGDGA